jgi:hypothetical protein
MITLLLHYYHTVVTRLLHLLQASHHLHRVPELP